LVICQVLCVGEISSEGFVVASAMFWLIVKLCFCHFTECLDYQVSIGHLCEPRFMVHKIYISALLDFV